MFAIAMEPLAISIRCHLSITPLTLRKVDHSISLYADDVVLFLSHPEKSLSPLLEFIKTFGGFSGYTINWEKSELMPLVGDMGPDFLNILPFHITEDKIKYLGVVIPKNPNLLYKLNYLIKSIGT